jgi:predicted glycoside hydrolase/deacetylase ChbG (UPF0249 family)
MKWIVVNADDLGASPGVNRGIAEAHQHGPLTSVSLMVNMPASPDGARLARDRPALSVGLHAHLTDASRRALVDFATGEGCRAALNQQLRSFLEFMGRPPTHLDSHHNVHRNPRLLPYFLEAADRYGLPLRDHSAVRYFSSFYGQWEGETHLEQISVQNLIRLVDQEISAGVTELSCHPGYPDPQLQSSYRLERQAELETLCDPAVGAFLSAPPIQLVNFRLAMDLLAGQPADDGDKGVT